MAGSHITKNALALAMKELMAEMPMEKIKISDIVNRCNMNRQSFYYHFKDKYDLVNWIFYTEFVADLQKITDNQSWVILEEIGDFLYKNKAFYTNALKVNGQNSFSEYFNEIMYTIVLYHFEEYFTNETNQEFCSVFLTDAICTSIIRWLLEGTKNTPKEFINLLKLTMKGLTDAILDEEEQD